MSKTLKQLLDQVNGESGFDIPSSYIGSTDPNIIQLVAIANRVAILLRDMHLQFSINQASISMANGASTSDARVSSYPLPDDFLALQPDTSYQFGRIDQAEIPTNPSTWAYMLSRSGPQSLQVRMRILKNRLYVFSPDATQTVKFEYFSKWPIAAAFVTTPTVTPQGTPAQETFQKDGDVWLLDDPLFELDVKWRYKKEKGLDWQGDQQISQLYQNELRARDIGARTIGWPTNEWYPNAPFTNLWVN